MPSSSLPTAGPCVSPFAPPKFHVQQHSALLMPTTTGIIESLYDSGFGVLQMPQRTRRR